MNAGILGDLRRFGFDVLVGFCIFALIAVLILDGKVPRQLPEVSVVLSTDAQAAEAARLHSQTSQSVPVAPSKSTRAALSNAFRFTGGWTALAVMSAMFAMLYAFNLALFRRFSRSLALSRRRRLSTR